MDNSLRVWDIRPFAPQERCIKMMVGHAHNFEKVRNYYYFFFHYLRNIFLIFLTILELASLLLVARWKQNFRWLCRPICLYLGYNITTYYL